MVVLPIVHNTSVRVISFYVYFVIFYVYVYFYLCPKYKQLFVVLNAADISFWKNKQNLEGLSVRTIFVNVITQLIILLYLFDNDTSWIILISASVGLFIEAWKITKAVEARLPLPPSPLPLPPFLSPAGVFQRHSTGFSHRLAYLRRLRRNGPTEASRASAGRTGPPTPPGPRSL